MTEGESPPRGRADGPLLRSMARVLTGLHRSILRLSGGRVAGSLGGRTVVVLATQGRRSGRSRETALFGFPDDTSWLVVASNGGTAAPPQWFLNLQATPEARLRVRGRVAQVHARVLRPAEKELHWDRLVAAYRGYQKYQDSTDRDIPVVRLEPLPAR